MRCVPGANDANADHNQSVNIKQKSKRVAQELVQFKTDEDGQPIFPSVGHKEVLDSIKNLIRSFVTIHYSMYSLSLPNDFILTGI